MSKIYLVTYNPITKNKAGQEAIRKYSLPPFIDGSCRREPDFESPYPSITALCRGRFFAPRLKEQDTVVYITTKDKYEGMQISGWRLSAILEVHRRFDKHEKAGEWYISQGIKLPSNCMISGNDPYPLDKTVQHKDSLEEWDRGYKFRSKKWSVFLTCTPKYLELYHPTIITHDMMFEAFGRIPGTQNPPAISAEEYQKLIDICGIKF